MKLKIGTKLITGFMSLVVLMLVISVVAYVNIGKVAESADILVRVDPRQINRPYRVTKEDLLRLSLMEQTGVRRPHEASRTLERPKKPRR